MSESSKCGLPMNLKVAEAADAYPRCMQVTHELALQGGLTEVLTLLGRITGPQGQGNVTFTTWSQALRVFNKLD